jgi:hypothetical protein
MSEGVGSSQNADATSTDAMSVSYDDDEESIGGEGVEWYPDMIDPFDDPEEYRAYDDYTFEEHGMQPDVMERFRSIYGYDEKELAPEEGMFPQYHPDHPTFQGLRPATEDDRAWLKQQGLQHRHLEIGQTYGESGDDEPLPISYTESDTTKWPDAVWVPDEGEEGGGYHAEVLDRDNEGNVMIPSDFQEEGVYWLMPGEHEERRDGGHRQAKRSLVKSEGRCSHPGCENDASASHKTKDGRTRRLCEKHQSSDDIQPIARTADKLVLPVCPECGTQADDEDIVGGYDDEPDLVEVHCEGCGKPYDAPIRERTAASWSSPTSERDFGFEYVVTVTDSLSILEDKIGRHNDVVLDSNVSDRQVVALVKSVPDRAIVLATTLSEIGEATHFEDRKEAEKHFKSLKG